MSAAMPNEEQPPSTAEGVARNDALFRESNERIHEMAQSLGRGQGEFLPFLCECADLACTKVVLLSASEYEAVRRNPTRFINAPEHERSAHGWARVVERFDRYSIVEKTGAAAEIAAELDAGTRGAT